jgi:hypothetical protein
LRSGTEDLSIKQFKVHFEVDIISFINQYVQYTYYYLTQEFEIISIGLWNNIVRQFKDCRSMGISIPGVEINFFLQLF